MNTGTQLTALQLEKRVFMCNEIIGKCYRLAETAEKLGHTHTAKEHKKTIEFYESAKTNFIRRLARLGICQ